MKITFYLIMSKLLTILFFGGIFFGLHFMYKSISPKPVKQKSESTQNVLASNSNLENEATINTMTDLGNIRRSEIVYIQSTGRYVTIFMKNGRKRFVNQSFSSVVRRFPGLVPVRKKGAQDLPRRTYVNRHHTCYNYNKNTVYIPDWEKIIRPSRNCKSLVEKLIKNCI